MSESTCPDMGDEWRAIPREEMESAAVRLARMSMIDHGEDPSAVVATMVSATMDWARGREMRPEAQLGYPVPVDVARAIAETGSQERLIRVCYLSFAEAVMRGGDVDHVLLAIVRTALHMAALNPRLTDRLTKPVRAN